MCIPGQLEKFLLSSQKSLDVIISARMTIVVHYNLMLFFFFLIFGWALIKSLNEVAQLFTEVFKVQMKKKNLENNDDQHVGNNWIERHSFASLIV